MDFAVKRLPIGIEFFDEMIKNQYYYVDKTGMISELLRSGGKVTLFTRPRRFGKSLNMSMLKNFFSLQGDKRIFNEHLELLGVIDIKKSLAGFTNDISGYLDYFFNIEKVH